MTHLKYDLIGDIHGHADELRRLLENLGYARCGEGYRHSERRVIFLGDFIDRGPKIRETLEIVRFMMADGQALAVMGNHEFNALAFHTTCPTAVISSLRPSRAKTFGSMCRTLAQLNDSQLADALEWFRTLPMWLDVDGLRAVHACWDAGCIAKIEAALRMSGGITPSFYVGSMYASYIALSCGRNSVKGEELELPRGKYFLDKDGHQENFNTYSLVRRCTEHLSGVRITVGSNRCDVMIPYGTPPVLDREKYEPYPAGAPPVFVGHYWLHGEQPRRLSKKRCMPRPILWPKAGFLCAYRWNGGRARDRWCQLPVE